MSGSVNLNLSGVPETLLIPLYIRAMESQRPDAMMKDEKAVALVTHMNSGIDRVRQIPMTEAHKVMRIMLTRQIDCYARDFLIRHPEAVVVHIGCGLDSRFERSDNGQAEWYDLDFPAVIDLRRKFIRGEGGRYHLLSCSVLEDAWLNTVSAHGRRPFLFLAEGVFMYFKEEQVRQLVLTLRDRFPDAELVFDSWTPFCIWLGNRLLSRSHSRFTGLMQWGFRRSREIESWGDGIRLLDEWGYFDCPEQRLDSFRWMAPLFRLLKPMRIFRFRLGKAQDRPGDHVHAERIQ
ncbi:MAG: class I SAM-dependent methyltransferase [bacterium]|nr:class I SAM-dependent methyltransferase [bacterium]